MRHISEGVVTSTVNDCFFLSVLKPCVKMSSLKLVSSRASKSSKNMVKLIERDILMIHIHAHNFRE